MAPAPAAGQTALADVGSAHRWQHADALATPWAPAPAKREAGSVPVDTLLRSALVLLAGRGRRKQWVPPIGVPIAPRCSAC